jgi:hypothetical protein
MMEECYWHSLNPSVLASGATSSEEIGNAITSFFQEWTEANLSAMTDKATSEIMDGIANLFQGLADVSVNAIAIATTSRGQIYEEMVNFFQQDERSNRIITNADTPVDSGKPIDDVEKRIGELILIFDSNLEFIDENWLIDVKSPFVVAKRGQDLNRKLLLG